MTGVYGYLRMNGRKLKGDDLFFELLGSEIFAAMTGCGDYPRCSAPYFLKGVQDI